MPFIALLLLTLIHILSGYGILSLFGIHLKKALTITISLILGIAVASFVPFLLQLCFIPLTATAVFLSLALACLLLNIHNLLLLRKGGSTASFLPFRKFLRSLSFRIRPYEIPWLLLVGFLVFVSVWRCYYLPPTSRDALSGPEAIAEFAVREHTMVNSFFNVDLFTTNNQFKSPYLISLQIIYKMAGFPFGQVWLSLLFISFTILLYHLLKEKLHPIIAGLLLLLITMAPELYAYTFMILYDYSNMVYLFLGLYFLFSYFRDKVSATFYFAGLFIGIATYIRSETLALTVLFLPAILFMQLRAKFSYGRIAAMNGLFILPSLLGYYLPTGLYINHYLPVHYEVGKLLNHNLSDLTPLWTRYQDIFTRLLTGTFAIHLWGYIFFIFTALLLAEGLVFRRFNKDARNWLYAIVAVFIGLGLLGYMLPLFDLTDTTKRALFKILPLLVLYMANNELLIRLSTWVAKWENARTTPRSSVTAPAPASRTSPHKTPNKKKSRKQ